MTDRRKRVSDTDRDFYTHCFVWTLVILCVWTALALMLSCSAQAQTPNPPDAIWVSVTVYDPVEGPQQTACVARQGLRYTWDSATGFTLSGGCWMDADALFANGFDP